MSTIVLERLTKRYGEVLAVNNLNLSVRDREFLVIVGPSGCGKTTTLRLIAGLEDPDSGNIYIDGVLMNDVRPGKRGVQVIFTNYALWPHMKVFDEKNYTNLSFALKIRQWVDKNIGDRVAEVTQKIGIDRELFRRKPNELSEGQKQRVAIGRAITIPPKIFLMDDPMTNLDPPSHIRVREEILRVHRSVQTTTVYVTHNMADAMGMADRIAVMNDGSFVQVDTPKNLYNHPLNNFVADFIHSYNASFAWSE